MVDDKITLTDMVRMKATGQRVSPTRSQATEIRAEVNGMTDAQFNAMWKMMSDDEQIALVWVMFRIMTATEAATTMRIVSPIKRSAE